MMNLEHGQYYYDAINKAWLQFIEEKNGYYWFYLLDEDRHVCYYDFELENLREY